MNPTQTYALLKHYTELCPNEPEWVHKQLTEEAVKAAEEAERLRGESIAAYVDRCGICGGEITSCGEADDDGNPKSACQVCWLRARLAEVERNANELLKESADVLSDAAAFGSTFARQLELELNEAHQARTRANAVAVAMAEERDAWRKCADRLADTLQQQPRPFGNWLVRLNAEALADYDRLVKEDKR